MFTEVSYGIDDPAEKAAALVVAAFAAVNEIPHDHRGEICVAVQRSLADAYRLLGEIRPSLT
jgi:hypothetical protein